MRPAVGFRTEGLAPLGGSRPATIIALPRKNRIETVDTDSLEHTGAATARAADGKPLRVWGALPGERVAVERTRKRKAGREIALAREVEAASPHRVEPAEEHCSSCSPWQVLDPGVEAAWKRALVARAVPEALQRPAETMSVVDAEAYFGYRNKMELSFTASERGLELAFFYRGQKRKRPVDGCALAMPEINEAARAIRDHLDASGVAARRLKSLIVRASRAGDAIAMLFANDPEPPPIAEAAVSDASPVKGMASFYSDPRHPAASETRCLERAGELTLEETLLGRSFRYPASAFFQINPAVFEGALADVRRWVPGGRVCDLFAGVGTLGCSVTSDALVAVESEAWAEAPLRAHTEAAGLDAEIRIAPAAEAMDAIDADTTVLVDPPRAGLTPKGVRRLRRRAPRRIVYLACSPQAQGREVAELMADYELDLYRAYNMFPRTPHVETLCVLSRIPRKESG